MDQTIGIEVGFQRLFNRRHRRCGYRFAASRLGCALWLGGSGLGRPAALRAHRRSLALIAVKMCAVAIENEHKRMSMDFDRYDQVHADRKSTRLNSSH